MNILGLSSDFHDSSAAILTGGQVRAAAAEERFSYQKHDSSFPVLSAKACMQRAGLTAADIDFVAYHEDPVVKFSRVLASRVHKFPRGFFSFARSMREIIMGQLWAKFDVFKNLGVHPSKVHYVPHHLGHAAYAFATSEFSTSAILVLDAVGEWSSTTLFKARREGLGFVIEPIAVVPYPHSLGMLYSAFTAFLGFRVNDGECSTMALASFGKPRYLEQMRKILRAQADGTYELDLSYFDFSDPTRLPLSKSFYEIFGEPRSFHDKLPFSSLMNPAEATRVDERFQRFADIAASLQMALEEAVLALCAKLRRETGEENLCLAGGVALNSSMNGRILRESGFQSVHIPPDPGDGGGALGAALYLNSKFAREPSTIKNFIPAYGLAYDEQTAVELTDSLDMDEISAHRVTPTVLGRVQGLNVQRFSPDTFEDLAAETAHDLKNGKIVGWLRGGFENGARALGNRSLLCDPRQSSVAQRLSRNVKLRAAFRPYACSVTEERQHLLFENIKPGHFAGTRWMSSTQPVSDSGRALIAQTLHVDGTTRPQVLRREENPAYHELLTAWEAESQTPALLNTSFNESGFPLVSTPVDALLMFLRTDIDTLVLNDTIIRKRF